MGCLADLWSSVVGLVGLEGRGSCCVVCPLGFVVMFLDFGSLGCGMRFWGWRGGFDY